MVGCVSFGCVSSVCRLDVCRLAVCRLVALVCRLAVRSKIHSVNPPEKQQLVTAACSLASLVFELPCPFEQLQRHPGQLESHPIAYGYDEI
jgi:hypothetical protein